MFNQNWALALAYWLHLLATVTWIGGLVTLAWIIPSARQSLSPEVFQTLVGKLQTRLQSLGWFSLIILAGTGMFQLSANPHHAGFLEITNFWALVILIKHIVIVGMVGISAYLTWGITPSLRRAAFRQGRGLEITDIENRKSQRIQLRERCLLNLNLVLALAVLALTALARAS
jgi:uncharacterized membrane protein